MQVGLSDASMTLELGDIEGAMGASPRGERPKDTLQSSPIALPRPPPVKAPASFKAPILGDQSRSSDPPIPDPPCWSLTNIFNAACKIGASCKPEAPSEKGRYCSMYMLDEYINNSLPSGRLFDIQVIPSLTELEIPITPKLSHIHHPNSPQSSNNPITHFCRPPELLQTQCHSVVSKAPYGKAHPPGRKSSLQTTAPT